ncbi:MAG: response regulator [Deltaproteobacteria bacterium]|nr:response regulator [Deltaproteobacteria bacterium]
MFRVFLPLAAEAVRKPKEETIRPPETKGGGTVLLIEDTDQVRQLGVRMLEYLGWRVLAARDGMEGVAIFRERSEEIDWVLSDLTMPRMDGWKTIAALRQIRPEIPVILASGYDEASVMSGDHAEQPQVFLGKPYSLEDLRAAIGKVQKAVEIEVRSQPVR